MDLTPKQKLALYQIYDAITAKSRPEIKLGGYAGTGKTVLAKYLSHLFPDFAVCAYTGKAANVLRKRDLAATTIHSRIYRPVYENGSGRLLGFTLHEPEDFAFKGFICDEASMVSKEIYQDMASFKLPLIFIGDHGQLEPVGTEFNLMKKPDIALEEIHRNAGPIARFAEKLRKGFRACANDESDKVFIRSQRYLQESDYLSADQVICAYNKTRVNVNRLIRSALGLKANEPQVNDKVMCLMNNKRMGLFNGMQGYIRGLFEDEYGRLFMDFESDGILYTNIWYDNRFFNTEKPAFDYDSSERPNPFDYAYAITCHKCQGDQWGKVLVLEQVCKNWEHKRWAYTAASRAMETLTWAN